MSNLPVIDLVFVVLIVLMVVHGYVKGFIEEIFSWASIVLAILLAVMFYKAGSEFLRTQFTALANVKVVPEILAFVAVFLIVGLVLKMLERLLKDVVMGMKLGGLNKALGAVFGVIEGLAITTLVLFVIRVVPFLNDADLLADSVFAEILLQFTNFPIEGTLDAINTALLPPGFPVLIT